MGSSSNSPETFKAGRRSISEARLLRQMSEVISLREQVAQVELAALASSQARDQGSGEAPPEG